jgi:hypothetical protein
MEKVPIDENGLSFKDMIRQTRDSERDRRWAFINTVRFELSRLACYPHGLPNAPNFRLDRGARWSSTDTENSVRIFTSNPMGLSLLHFVSQEVEYMLDGLRVVRHDLAVPAASPGHYRYGYTHTENFTPADVSRSPAAHKAAKIGMPQDQTPYTLVSRIVSLEDYSRNFSLITDIHGREHAEAYVLPQLRIMTPALFEVRQ